MKNSIGIFSMIKNENDFVKKFVDHNIKIASEFTVVDNGSTDGTLEILKNYGDKIRLIEDQSSFGRKGSIITHHMLRSKCDLLVALDADELIVFDDGEVIETNPFKVRQYLENIVVNENERYSLKNSYMSHPDEKGWYQRVTPNKRILARKGFKSIDCGYHEGNMEKNSSPKMLNLAYLHFHFRSKEAWYKSTKQKLKARLGEKWDDLFFLSSYKGRSFHVGKEFIRFKTTNNWHNVDKQIFIHDSSI